MTPVHPRPALPDTQNQGWGGAVDAQTHPSSRWSSSRKANRPQGAPAPSIWLLNVSFAVISPAGLATRQVA